MTAASSPRREAGLALAGTAVVLAVALVGLGLAGALPGFPASPFARAGASGSTASLSSFSAARALAEAVASPAPPAGWYLVGASGYALALGGTLSPPAAPPPPASTNTSTCSWTSPSGATLAPVDLPAVPASAQGRGLASVWAFVFAHGSALELVVVGAGKASVYAVSSLGASCTGYGVGLLPIPEGMVDSSGAASVVLSWGGAALLANDTAGTSAVYSLFAPSYYFPTSVGNNGTSGGGPVPPTNATPVRFGPLGYSWEMSLYGCSASLPPRFASLFATVNATSGQLESFGGFQSSESGVCPTASTTFGWPFWIGPVPIGVGAPPPPVVLAARA